MKKFQTVRNEAIDHVIQFIRAWYANERYLKGENLYIELAKLRSKKICAQCFNEQSDIVKFSRNGSVLCNHCAYVNRRIRESKSKEDATFFSRKFFKHLTSNPEFQKNNLKKNQAQKAHLIRGTQTAYTE